MLALGKYTVTAPILEEAQTELRAFKSLQHLIVISTFIVHHIPCCQVCRRPSHFLFSASDIDRSDTDLDSKKHINGTRKDT